MTVVRLALRTLSSHRVRLALTVLTVALGIAFIAGTNIFTSSLKASFDALVNQPRADVTVSAQGSSGVALATLPATLLDAVRQLPQVSTAEGVVAADGAYVLGSDGRPVGPSGPPARARSWVDDPRVSPVSLSSGRAPAGPAEVALLDTTARMAGVATGSQVRIETPRQGVQAFTVVGTVTRGVSGGLGGTLAVFDLSTAQDLLIGPGQLTSLLVSARQGVTQEELAAAVKPLVPARASVVTGAQAADEVATRIEQGFSFFNTFLIAFGLIALFVATFLIFNTFSMLVAQRARELALLRAVGLSRRQTFAIVLLEAAFIGALAAALGLVGGIGVSFGLRAILSALGLELPASPLVVTSSTALLAVGVGLGVTLLSALPAARRASGISPVAALREGVSPPTRSMLRISLIAIAMLLLAVPAAWMALARAEADGQVAALWLGVSALLAILGAIAITPAITRPMLAGVGAWMRRGFVGRLAVLNAIRNPRRTAATASALTIGLALMTAVAVMGSSAKASVAEVVDSTIGADFVLIGQGFSPMSHEVYDSVRGTPGTDVVAYVRTVPMSLGVDTGAQIPVTGVDPVQISQVLDISSTPTPVDQLALGTAVVDTAAARDQGIAVGDTVRGSFINGPGSLRIVGTFEAAGPVRGLITTLSTVDAIGTLTRDTAIYISLAPDASADAVRAELTSRLATFPSVQVQDQADIKSEINGSFDVLFGLVYALLGLSVIIAFLGIVNTLSLSVIERTREIGLLRAVGTSRAQIRRMILVEALLLAFLGCIVGLSLGLVYGSLLQRVLQPQGITVLAFPVVQLAVFTVLSLVGAVAAAVWPAWRAGRLGVLTAMGSG